MKKKNCVRLTIRVAVLAMAWAFPTIAQAHGVGSRWRDDGRNVRAVTFAYVSGEPMAYVKIKVFGPGDEKMEFQNGRADRQGVFAFVPDKPGPWRVEAQDEEGHKAVAETVVASETGNSVELLTPPAGKDKDQGAPWLRAAFGVSAIFNVFAVIAWLRLAARRRVSGETEPGA